MPSPLEIYRAWEREAPATVCHVMIIHAGDGSAAQRITLTDKPYRDSKGFEGVKYHHLYPAPMQAIVSDIETRESIGGATISDIRLSNYGGRFNDIFEPGRRQSNLGLNNVIGRTFSIHRGDQRWSLLEEEYPERFVLIARGVIEEIGFGKNGLEVVLKLTPVQYPMDKNIASADSPLALGAVINCPGVLVDASLQRYRFSSVIPQQGTGSGNFVLRDNGVPLTGGGFDFSLIEEDGKFRGLVEMSAAPAGRLTADFSDGSLTYDKAATDQLAYLFHYFSGLDYGLPSDSVEIESPYPETNGSMQMKPDKTRLYFIGGSNSDSGGTLYEYSLTDGDITTSTRIKALSMKYSGPCAITQDGLKVIQVIAETHSSFNRHIVSYTLGVAWDFDTLSADNNETATGLYGNAIEVLIDKDVKVVKLHKALSSGLSVHHYDLSVPGDVTTITEDPTKRFATFSGACAWTEDGKYFYDEFRQYRMLTPFDTETMVYENRAYLKSPNQAGLRETCIAPDGSRFYYVDVAFGVTRFDLVQLNLPENYNFPYSVFDPSVLLASEDIADITAYSVGVHYSSETSMGRSISDILAHSGSGYYISRKGAISTGVLHSREQTFGPTSESRQASDGGLLSFSDATWAKNVRQRQPRRSITLTYQQRGTTQSEDSMSGSVSAADRAFYARSFSSEIKETGHEGEGAGDETIETHLHDSFQASATVNRIAESAKVPREEYEVKLVLSEFSELNPLRVYDRIFLPVPYNSAFWPALLRAQVLEVGSNWSKSTQTVRVLD